MRSTTYLLVWLGIATSLPSLALEKPLSAHHPKPKLSNSKKNDKTEAERSSELSSAQSKQTASEVSLLAHQAAVASSLRAYRESPSATAWQTALKDLANYARQPQTFRVGQATLFQAIPALAELGTKIIDFPGGRLWNFTKVPESRELMLQWQIVSTAKEKIVRIQGRRKIVRSFETKLGSDLLPLSEAIHLKEARLVSSYSVITTGKKTVRIESPRSLVILGNEKSGGSYLHAFRVTAGTWHEVADIFSSIPPYILENLSSKASFSGNDLVLSIGGINSLDSVDKGIGIQSSLNGYRIVLKLISGKYCLEEGKLGEEGAFSIASQFACALEQNKPELAKIWLADTKLISIPKYVGFFSKTQPSIKIIPMISPISGTNRFRLVTTLKEDLILDVGKTKSLPLAIKALFIAPPDPLANKLLNNLTVHEQLLPPSSNEEIAK